MVVSNRNLRISRGLCSGAKMLVSGGLAIHTSKMRGWHLLSDAFLKTPEMIFGRKVQGWSPGSFRECNIFYSWDDAPKSATLRIFQMSWGVKTTCLEAPGVSLGGSGASIRRGQDCKGGKKSRQQSNQQVVVNSQAGKCFFSVDNRSGRAFFFGAVIKTPCLVVLLSAIIRLIPSMWLVYLPTWIWRRLCPTAKELTRYGSTSRPSSFGGRRMKSHSRRTSISGLSRPWLTISMAKPTISARPNPFTKKPENSGRVVVRRTCRCVRPRRGPWPNGLTTRPRTLFGSSTSRCYVNSAMGGDFATQLY